MIQIEACDVLIETAMAAETATGGPITVGIRVLTDGSETAIEVDWDEVLSYMEKQYEIRVEDERKHVPPPKKQEPERKQAPIPDKPKKKNIWDRITDDIREIFLGGKRKAQPPAPEPKPQPTKRTVFDKVSKSIRKMFGRK